MVKSLNFNDISSQNFLGSLEFFSASLCIFKPSKEKLILQKITGCEIDFPKTPKYTQKVDVGNFVVNNNKLKALGWKPNITIEKGISKTLEYFSKNKI